MNVTFSFYRHGSYKYLLDYFFIIDILINFSYIYYRLDPTSDAEDIQLIRDIFNGGESRRMGPTSIAVRIETNNHMTPDTFQSWQSGNHAVTVQMFQSFQAGEIISNDAMDAILQLFINRDQQMCDAYLQVNEKKPGYVQRSETLYIKSSFSTKLMRDESAEAMLEDPSIVLCIEKHYLLKPYRCIIPLLWNNKNEWILIIIDPAAHSVEIIYPQYSVDVLQASSGDERVSNSIYLRDKLISILSASNLAVQTNPNPPEPWLFYYIYNSAGTNNILKYNMNHRIPDGMDCGLVNHVDSGLYVLYAIECDYYDCPIFATTHEDFDNIRMKLSHCVLNKQLII